MTALTQADAERICIETIQKDTNAFRRPGATVYWATAEELHAAMEQYHREACAKQAGVGPVYQLRRGDGISWVDQDKDQYEYNVKYGNAVRILYTAPQPHASDGRVADALRRVISSYDREPRGGVDKDSIAYGRAALAEHDAKGGV